MCEKTSKARAWDKERRYVRKKYPALEEEKKRRSKKNELRMGDV